jgi:hypothetical protein
MINLEQWGHGPRLQHGLLVPDGRGNCTLLRDSMLC